MLFTKIKKTPDLEIWWWVGRLVGLIFPTMNFKTGSWNWMLIVKNRSKTEVCELWMNEWNVCFFISYFEFCLKYYFDAWLWNLSVCICNSDWSWWWSSVTKIWTLNYHLLFNFLIFSFKNSSIYDFIIF